MKKILSFVALALAFSMFVSCGSTPKQEVVVASDVPEWYILDPVSKDGIYGTGQAKMADFDTSLKLAEANAKVNLAGKVSTVVKSVTQTMVSGSKTDTMKGFEENALLTAEATIAGAQRTNFYQAKDGTVYIQVFLPYETAVTTLNKTAEKYEISAEYLATQVKMQENYEKYFGKK